MRHRLTCNRLLLIGALSLVSWLTFSTVAWARLARLQSVEGGVVYLKRSNWSDFYQTYPPTMLNGDDLLRIEPGTLVTLLCPDNTESDTVSAGVSSVTDACPDTPRRVRPVFGVSDTWSATDPEIPYVITPWSGQVLTPTPHLRWNAVAGARQYTITLQKRVGADWSDVWTVISDQTVLCYPANQPALELGAEYALRVVAGTGTASSQEWIPTAVFSLVGGRELADAEAEIAAVRSIEAPEAFKTVLLAEEVYPKYKLFAQGIDELLSLIESGAETAHIYRLLGDYYIRSGQALPTEDSYLKALTLAEAEDHLEEQVKVRWGLGTLYNRIGQPEQAREQLLTAQQGATELGDTDLIASIEAELEK
ncbi:MAG: tetratricopeptide repeat protein [Cyanobacteria bacterium P01_D01_bin.156]